MVIGVDLRDAQFYELNDYVRKIPDDSYFKRSVRAKVCAAVSLYVLAVILTLAIVCSAGFSSGVMAILVGGVLFGVVMACLFLYLFARSLRDVLFKRNEVYDSYYHGLRFWDLTRAATTKPAYNETWYAPFKKYLPLDSILSKIALILEHFVRNPFHHSLVIGAKILLDYRPDPVSVCFPVTNKKTRTNIICEAFRSDSDAQLAMRDCYRLIFAKNLIKKANFKSLDVVSSSMAAVDYPSPKNDPGRHGLVRLYYDQDPGFRQFPLLIPNYRLPQGPLYNPLHGALEKKEEVILEGLEELLQLCIQQKYFFALQWDNICFDKGLASQNLQEEAIAPTLKIRSMEPAITSSSKEYGIVCEALCQWASVLGSEAQINWLKSRLDGLAFAQSLGAQNAEIVQAQDEGNLESTAFEAISGQPSSSEEGEGIIPLVNCLFSTSKEPSVKLSEQEKALIRARLEVRSQKLTLFREQESSLDQEGFDPIGSYEQSRKDQLTSFVKKARVQNRIILTLPNEIKQKIALPSLLSCAKWLLSFFDEKYAEENLRTELTCKDSLTHGLYGKNNFCLRMTRVLEPGIEPWYSRSSQIEEVRAALQAMCCAGFISSFYETEVPGRFTVLS